MTHDDANAEVERLRHEYPEAIMYMEDAIGPIPVATERDEQETIDHMMYMVRLWCKEVYIGG